jgi:hypothetical protein
METYMSDPHDLLARLHAALFDALDDLDPNDSDPAWDDHRATLDSAERYLAERAGQQALTLETPP